MRRVDREDAGESNMKNRWTLFLFAVLVTTAPAYESLQGPTELLHWDEGRAYNGYTLFGAHGTSYLIDMEGRVVHTWRGAGTNPRLLDNGNLLDASRDDPSGFQGFKEVDWEGRTVWEYRESRAGYFPHHDFVRIYNKKLKAWTTLYIANKSVTPAQAVSAGCDPRNIRMEDRGQQRGGPGQRGKPGSSPQMDAVVEVDMDGNVVWEWWFFDHVIQDRFPDKANFVGEGKSIADYPGRININLPGRPLRRDWLHCNSLDYNAELDQVVINSVQGEFYVIDHGRTFVPGNPEESIRLAACPAGDFLYRFGDPARYEQGDPPRVLEDWTATTSGHKQIGGSHDVQWIKPGLPGAGNFLVFNNGQYLLERTAQSYVMEINGLEGARYINPPAAGYREVRAHKDTHKPARKLSNQVVWLYGSKSNQGFFSHIGSGCQRLPNGNTLICSDTEGHLFEVTRDGDLAWEYINPITREHGAVKVMPDSLPMANSLFRAYRYGFDHPAFKGRTLSPRGLITDTLEQEPRRQVRARETSSEPPRTAGAAQEGRRDPGRSRNPVMIALDADGDGVVSKEEMDNAASSLKRLDRDGDGWLRRDEVRPGVNR